MTLITLEFYECEHDGDLQHYIDDIVKCGGEVINSSVDDDEEIGTIVVKYDNINGNFLQKFKETETYGFIN